MSNDGLVKLVQETMKHAVPSMFVTSLTTAVAFFASVVSNVTAINCFRYTSVHFFRKDKSNKDYYLRPTNYLNF